MTTQNKSWSSLARDIKDTDFKNQPKPAHQQEEYPKFLPERKTPEGNRIFYIIYSDWFVGRFKEWASYGDMKKFAYDQRNDTRKVKLIVKMSHDNHVLWKTYHSWFDVYKNVFVYEEWKKQ
jgi:hypothetical protein